MSMTNFNHNLVARAIDIIGFLVAIGIGIYLFFNGMIVPSVGIILAGFIWLRLNYRKDINQVIVNCLNIIMTFGIIGMFTMTGLLIYLSQYIKYHKQLDVTDYYLISVLDVIVSTLVLKVWYRTYGLLFNQEITWPDFDIG